MEAGSTEFYEMLDQFEKASKVIPAHSLRFDRADKGEWKHGYFYNHGETNALFHAFMCGYGAGKTQATA